MLENQQIDVYPLPSSTPAVVPYSNLINSSQYAKNNFQPKKRTFGRSISATENEAALKRTLKQYWGHGDFRKPQLDVCLAAMRGWDIMVVAPTGLGKSVCFQVPAITLEHGITIVVVPLIALMKDQVDGLKAKGVQVAMICEKSSTEEEKEASVLLSCLSTHFSPDQVKRQLRMGHPEIRLLYLTPETLFSRRHQNDIKRAYDQKQIRRLVIDEAHVIEEWGLTFRPTYRQLGEFRNRFPNVPITALTASATEEVRNDIYGILGITKKKLAQWVLPFNRKNLFYEVRYRDQESRQYNADDIADYIIRFRPEAARRNKESGIIAKCVSGLVYCRSRRSCVEMANLLRQRGINALPFHAELSKLEKDDAQTRWKAGDVECIVATVAFGMGVDQPHVRYVIHYDMPKSFEGFYQETGRAGRDGHLSRCVLYYSREDALQLRGLLEKEAEKDLGLNKKGMRDSQAEVRQQAKRRCINSFKALQVEYADPKDVGDLICRHIAICRYFGERIDDKDWATKQAYCDNMCDVCTDQSAVRRRLCLLNDEVAVASQIERLSSRVSLSSEISSANVSDNPTRFQSEEASASSDAAESPDQPEKYWRHPELERNRPPVPSWQQNPDPLRLPNDRVVTLPVITTPTVRHTSAGQSRDRYTAPVSIRSTSALSIRPTATRTTDSVAGTNEGSYAEAAALPTDAKKRKRQEEAFKQVQPATGDGPFSYYNTDIQGGPSPSVRAVTRFKTPFKVPLREDPQTKRIGAVGCSIRQKGLKSLQICMSHILRTGGLADRLWTLFGREEEGAGREKVIKKAARELEAEIVVRLSQDQQYPAAYAGTVDDACKAIRLLGTEMGVEVMERDELDTNTKFRGSKYSVVLRLVEAAVKGVRRM